MKLKIAVDVEDVTVKVDGMMIYFRIPIRQDHLISKAGAIFKTGLSGFLSQSCARDIARKLDHALKTLEADKCTEEAGKDFLETP